MLRIIYTVHKGTAYVNISVLNIVTTATRKRYFANETMNTSISNLLTVKLDANHTITFLKSFFSTPKKENELFADYRMMTTCNRCQLF